MQDSPYKRHRPGRSFLSEVSTSFARQGLISVNHTYVFVSDRVKAVYPPGIVVIVRLEDNTLTVLRGDSQELRNHLATSYDKVSLCFLNAGIN